MKKLIITLLLVLSIGFSFASVACNKNKEESSSSKTSESQSVITHTHSVVKIMAQGSTCTKEGNIEFYYCSACQGYFMDENAQNQTSFEQTRVAKLPHSGVKVGQVDATCAEKGKREHWVCEVCSNTFADENCTQRLTGSALEISPLAHENIVHSEGYPVDGDTNGEKEHWYCSDCDSYFLDANYEERVTAEDVVIYSLINIPDFIVEVPTGRDPIILQLTDTQIIDGSQLRPGLSEGDRITYAPEKIDKYCYQYLTEIITNTHPDFIIITGDLVYGKYDDNGSVLTAFVKFMDSFKIPWSPVFGNHEAESKKGVDWQCEQFENAEYCLFEQKELTGNGNYSVAIRQGGEIVRVFYMLDSNGCSDASAESLVNGHTTTSVGFGNDQVEWYTNQINEIKTYLPEIKISFAYHIQQAVFAEAYAKYGFNQSEKYHDIHVDYLGGKADGDFGYIGRQMKTAWDSSKVIFNGMKELGADSIFVGHEHCNSASVVYEGVRFQYGQKSSEYDRYNAVTSEGKIVAVQIFNTMGTPLVGGSVIVLSQTDGAIKDAYIYYCENAGANVDWDAIYNK